MAAPDADAATASTAPPFMVVVVEKTKKQATTPKKATKQATKPKNSSPETPTPAPKKTRLTEVADEVADEVAVQLRRHQPGAFCGTTHTLAHASVSEPLAHRAMYKIYAPAGSQFYVLAEPRVMLQPIPADAAKPAGACMWHLKSRKYSRTATDDPPNHFGAADYVLVLSQEPGSSLYNWACLRFTTVAGEPKDPTRIINLAAQAVSAHLTQAAQAAVPQELQAPWSPPPPVPLPEQPSDDAAAGSDGSDNTDAFPSAAVELPEHHGDGIMPSLDSDLLEEFMNSAPFVASCLADQSAQAP